MKKLLVLLFSLPFLVVSCADKIDGTSDENYQTSLEKIRSKLNDSEKEKFTEALQKIAFENVEINNLSDLSNLDGILEKTKDMLDGMTYEDVITGGNRVQKIIDKRNKEQAKIEITELYEKKKNSKKDSLELSKFKVEKSRYYKRKDYFGYEPVIEITVINNTKHAISRAYFEGTIKSPERTIPWLVEDFNYEISGGLESGERANWRLAPNSFSEWGTVKAPKDAIFTVIVTKLDGADGEKLFSIDFDEDDKERLNELLKDYPEFVK